MEDNELDQRKSGLRRIYETRRTHVDNRRKKSRRVIEADTDFLNIHKQLRTHKPRRTHVENRRIESRREHTRREADAKMVERRLVGSDRREVSRMDAMDNRRQGKTTLKTKSSDVIANLSSIELEEVIRNETLGGVPNDSGDDI